MNAVLKPLTETTKQAQVHKAGDSQSRVVSSSVCVHCSEGEDDLDDGGADGRQDGKAVVLEVVGDVSDLHQPHDAEHPLPRWGEELRLPVVGDIAEEGEIQGRLHQNSLCTRVSVSVYIMCVDLRDSWITCVAYFTCSLCVCGCVDVTVGVGVCSWNSLQTGSTGPRALDRDSQTVS